ncbi:MAG: zf-HC2 domain-containing protein [Gemmatimonadota bacterium]|nr:MAG: zf-HC2 domain-containing protein [Gemmatimonadota bacterium]
MRCSQVRKLLSPYIDGELSERKAEKIRDHVSHCTICGEALQALQNLDALSRETYAHEPSEAYWANFLPRLHRRIEAAPPRSFQEKVRHVFGDILFPSGPWLKAAGAVASVVLIFFVGRAVIQHKGIDTLVTSPGEKRFRENVERVADTVPERAQKGEVEIEDKEDTAHQKDAAEREPSADLDRQEEFVSPPVTQKSEGTKGSPPVTLEAKETEAPPPAAQDRGAERVSISPSAPKEADEAIRTYVETQKSSKKMYAVTGDESQLAYEQALRSQKLGENESASAQFQYILDNYPKSPVADDAQFQLNLAQRSGALESQDLSGWQQQRDAWRDFLQTYSNSELADEACLRLAESWFHVANMTLSKEDLSQALEVNRNCLIKRKGESVLKKQIQDLEKALKEHTE